MQTSLGYIPLIREPSSNTVISTTGGERRRDGTANESSIFSPTQTLDHHYPHQHQQERQSPPLQHSKGRDSVTAAATADPKGGRISTPGTTRTATSSICYRECLKNHAASIGGHVMDGCGEFMPIGNEGTPEALKCAVCNCHRNFHRKDVDGKPQSGANFYYCYNQGNKINNSRSRIPPLSLSLQAPPPLQQHQKFPIGLATSPPSGPIPSMMMAFGSGGVTESSSEELNMAAAPPPRPPFVLSSKKRFRTKFTQEQKDKMLEFAEKVGWRIQKQDEAVVEKFCAELGVKRQVLKVWMHNNNNKHSMKKKE